MTDFHALLRFDIANSDILRDLVLRTKPPTNWVWRIDKKKKVRYNMFERSQEVATKILALPRVGHWLREWRDSAHEKTVGEVAEEMKECIEVLRSNSCWGSLSYEIDAAGIILFHLLLLERQNRIWRMAINRRVFDGALYHPVMELRLDGKYAFSEVLDSEADLPNSFLFDVKFAEALACHSHDPENKQIQVVNNVKKIERMLPMVAAWVKARPWMKSEFDLMKILAYMSELEENDVHQALFTMGWW